MIQFLSYNSKDAAPLFTTHISEGCIASILSQNMLSKNVIKYSNKYPIAKL